SSGGASLKNLEDHSILASGKNSAKEIYEVVARVDSGALRAIRLEGLTHASLTKGGAGRSNNSNVVLTEFEAEVAPVAEETATPQWRPIKFVRAWADHEQANGDFKIANAVDGKPQTGWATAGYERLENRTAVFLSETPFGRQGGALLKIRLKHESIYEQHQFGRFRLAVSKSESLPQFDGGSAPAAIVKLIQVPVGKRNAKQQQQLREHYRGKVSADAALKKIRDELAAARKRKTDLEKSLPTTLIWKELAKPKPAHILLRGAYDKPGELVERNTPAALPPLAPLPEGEIPNRLHLASWLVSDEHPLTSRVTVNRFWQQYFGVGIVETSEDFGSQGSQPSHPRLLDWLAVEFRESGWDVKALQKRIVLSAAYRQSSRGATDAYQKDPKNRLLARGPRFRMDAEMIRDAALAASGSLNPALGGPSVKPYQPDGIWFAVGYTDSNTARFKRDSGDALYRRGVYTFWKRTAPPPTLATLDAPSRETCTVRRSRTNTPLAALALMNDEQFVEASRRLAKRMMTEGGESEASQAALGFRLATSRLPNASEQAVLMKVFQAALAVYQKDPEAAGKLITVGESKPDASLDPARLAAWTIVANMIFNLDETLTKG
ncbi:MAG: DUF1553 domain-containing protein, partial [Planctomycetales bacterium]